MRRRSHRVSGLAAALLLIGMVTPMSPPVRADDDPTLVLQKMKNDQERLDYIRAQKGQAENEYQRATWQAMESQQQLSAIERDLDEASARVAELTNQQILAQEALNRTETQLQIAEQQYAERKEMLAARVRTINENGHVNYIAVLLGSESFGDLISRFEMLRTVVKQDSELLEEIRKEKDALEEQRQQAVAQRDELARLTAEAEERQRVLQAKTDEQSAVTATFESAQQQVQAMLDQRASEEARIKIEIALAQRKINGTDGIFAPIAPVTSYVLTDRFGMRINPITGRRSMHNGLDFAVPKGTPVMAIDDGVVIVAGWSNSYGNYVVISHGDGIVSLAAHHSQLQVSVGDTVTQGQIIALAGSTGWSTGPHVHLEIHVNDVPVDPQTFL